MEWGKCSYFFCVREIGCPFWRASEENPRVIHITYPCTRCRLPWCCCWLWVVSMDLLVVKKTEAVAHAVHAHRKMKAYNEPMSLKPQTTVDRVASRSDTGGLTSPFHIRTSSSASRSSFPSSMEGVEVSTRCLLPWRHNATNYY